MFESLIWLVPPTVLVAGLWRPHAGVVALTAALPLFGVPPGGPYLAALDVAALAAIGTAWRAGPVPRSPLDRPVLAFVAVSLASMVPPVYHPPSWQPRVFLGLLEVLPNVQTWSALYSWRAAANLVLGVFLYFAVRRAFTGRSLRPLGLALAAGLLMILTLGLAARTGTLELWGYRAIGGPLWDPRLHSLFFHSGWLAKYLVLVTPVATTVVLGRSGRNLAAVAMALAALAALAFTLQRGAWVAVIAQLIVAAILFGRESMGNRHRRRRLVLGAGVAVVLISSMMVARPGLVAPIEQRLGDGQQLSGRWTIWQTATAMTRERPLLGWGLGAFVPAFEGQENPIAASHWLTPHNHYLMLAAERGLIGLAAFGLIGWVLALSLRQGLVRDNPIDQTITRGLILAFAGFAVYGLVQYFFFLKMIEWLFWLLAAIGANLAQGTPTRRTDRAALSIALVATLMIPWRLAVTPRLEAATSGTYGFHRSEITAGEEFSWTERRAARRVAWEDEILVLELANGHPEAGQRPSLVTIRVDGQVRARLTLRGGWEEHRVVLGPPQQPSILVSLEVAAAFRPFRDFQRHPELERSRDIRQLGVAVRGIRWTRDETTDD